MAGLDEVSRSKDVLTCSLLEKSTMRRCDDVGDRSFVVVPLVEFGMDGIDSSA